MRQQGDVVEDSLLLVRMRQLLPVHVQVAARRGPNPHKHAPQTRQGIPRLPLQVEQWQLGDKVKLVVSVRRRQQNRLRGLVVRASGVCFDLLVVNVGVNLHLTDVEDAGTRWVADEAV